MVLQYMLLDHDLANRKTSDGNTKAKRVRTKRRAIICIILLVCMIMANFSYNLWTKDKRTPVRKLLTASVINDLWTTRRRAATKAGTVVGVLYSRENPCALINREIVYEGETTNGVKVVKIDKSGVEFERNGKRWTQKVLANPNFAWKTVK